jgi:hypothetical protein
VRSPAAGLHLETLGEPRCIVKHALPAHVLGVLVVAALAAAVATQSLIGNARWGFFGFLPIMLAVGWFLATKLPGHPLGWLIMIVPGLFALQVPLDLLGQALLPVAPDTAAWLLWYGTSTGATSLHGFPGPDRLDIDTWPWLLPVGLMLTQIPLRFPTGQLPSPKWRWFSWYSVAALVASTALLSTMTAEVYPGLPNPVHLPGIAGQLPPQIIVAVSLFPVAVIGSLGSLVVRYRRADAPTRAQVRWVLWSVTMACAAFATDGLLPVEFTIVHDWILLLFALIPISITVAVLRYRLYAIDRIISRTAAYVIVTLLVVAVYALVVTSMTSVLPNLPSIGVALATLASAAIFLPVLRWVQRGVDRHFDRERYDAQMVVEAFGEHLRSDLDPNSTGDELIEAVKKALHPSAVGLWTPEGRDERDAEPGADLGGLSGSRAG